MIQNCDKVFILPHLNPDFDAIASSVGMSLFVNGCNKESRIIIGDAEGEIKEGVKAMIDVSREYAPFDCLKKYERTKGSNDLHILCDVNKPKLTCIKSIDKDHLAIVDHHNQDAETFEAALSHIDTTKSSASEIVTALLTSKRIKIPKKLADILYAGILLDTDKLNKHIKGDTHRIIGRLVDFGATLPEAREYFTEDVYSNRIVEKLVENAQILNYRIGIMPGDEKMKYKTEELARAADELLTKKVDATFAIGNIGDGVVSISARSNNVFDSGQIMGQLSGGGGPNSAATKLEGVSVAEATKQLKKALYFTKHEA